MNDDALTDLVAAFLAQRAADPAADVEAFARAHANASPRLLPALRGALAVQAALDLDVDAPLPRIGDYRVVGELGRGGMGIVHEVERDGRRLALKRLSAAALLHAHARDRLRREAEALARIEHPGVVRVHEVGEAHGIPHVVMDLVEGRTLAGLGPLPWPEVVRIGQGLALALAAVHAAGLCHRDLKPENVVLQPDGSPVLIDFGLVHDDSAATLTGTGDLLGTPRYLAPEQALGRTVDARTDLFALGLVLAELLTGEPVRSSTDRQRLLVEARGGARVALPRTVPRGLATVLRRALARRPEDRYATAAELADELGRVGRGEPVRSRPPGPIARAREFTFARPRLAGLAATLGLAAATFAAVELAAWRRAGRAASTRAAFADAVTAYVAGNRERATLAAQATLGLAPGHEGALCLAALARRGAKTQAGAPAERPERPELADLSDLPAPLADAVRLHAGGDWTAAATAWVEAAAAAPASPLPLVLAAEAHGKAGDRPRAVAELAAAAQLLPPSAAVAAAIGRARLAAQDPDGAARDLHAAVALEPAAWRWRQLLAQALYSVDAAAGLDEAQVARRLLGDARTDAWFELANLEATLLDKLDRHAEAIVVLRQLAAARPADARFAYNLGYALDRALEVAEARQWYERCLELAPDNRNATLCLVWLLATAAPPLQDEARAESLLLATLERDGGRSDAVLQMVREFGLRTRRIAALGATLARLADTAGIPPARQATLRHTRSFLENAAKR